MAFVGVAIRNSVLHFGDVIVTSLSTHAHTHSFSLSLSFLGIFVRLRRIYGSRADLMLDLVSMNFIALNIKKGEKNLIVLDSASYKGGIVCLLLSVLDIACYIIRLFSTLTVAFVLGIGEDHC